MKPATITPPYEQLQPETIIPPSLVTQEKKEERRKVLEAVRQRRKIMYQRFDEKMKQHSPTDDFFS